MVNSERLRVLVHSPYRKTDGLPSGVNNLIEESIPHLERLGCEIKTVRPSPLWYPIQKKDDSDYHLGRGFPAIAKTTDFEVGLAFNKRGARDILEDAKPHIVVCHEPAIPFAAHTLISANPKVEGDKRLVPFIAVQHAGMPDGGVERLTELVRELLIIARRPKLQNFRPTFTPGWVATLKKEFSGWIAVSKGTRDFWKRYNPQEYTVIYNGIEIDDFSPEGEIFDEWKIGNRKNVLGVGRHDRRKGFDDLLRAHKKNIEAGYDEALWLTGGGEMTERLKEIVQAENIPNVEFLGFLSKNDLAKAYRTADIVVASSVGGEGFNRTIAEGRISGTLVVCTDIDGQREAIGVDLAPFMAKPRNPEDLARQIREMLGLPEEYAQELKEKSRKDAIQSFGWETIAGQYITYFDGILSKHGELPVWKGSTRTFASNFPIAGQIFVRDHVERYEKAA